jgi:guanosine-3',5'-bis(diphosphate) 3'-pyrophosphohydrolase
VFEFIHLETVMNQSDLKMLDRAILYAAEAHAFQLRRGSFIPFVTHPIAVMTKLANIGVSDQVVLAAAVLHDVLEDTKRTYLDLAEVFKTDVADLVAAVSFDKTATKLDKVKAIAQMNTNAANIKLADVFCNLSDYLDAIKRPGDKEPKLIIDAMTFGNYARLCAEAYPGPPICLVAEINAKADELFSAINLLTQPN